MLQNRHIAFFIDVDNAALSDVHYNNVIEQLCDMGEILSGKIYGAGERKHKRIFADADQHGYRIERPMRNKRRGRREFDNRIFVDVVDAVNSCAAIDAVCIVAQPCDMVYLYSYLRSRGIKIIALDNADEASCAFVDEVIDLGKLVHLKLPHSGGTRVPHLSFEEFTDAPVSPSAEQTEQSPFVAESSDEPQPQQDDSADGAEEFARANDDLLKEIQHLKDLVSQNASAQHADKQHEQPRVEEPQPQPEQASIVDETNALLDKIARMGGDGAQQAQPHPQPQPSKPEPEPQTEYQPQNESDLIRRIEEIRRSNDNGDTDELIDEIRKLLDGLE